MEAADSSSPPSEAGRPGWMLWLDELWASERPPEFLAVLVGALVFLPYLGTLGFWDCWETHYGEVAREMLVRDDFVYPHWESAYFFSKPVLPLWLMALGFWVTGAEPVYVADAPLGAAAEWGARLPFAFLAMATLWAVYRIGRIIGGRTAGLASVLVLAASAQFIFIGKQAISDMPLLAFTTIGLSLLMSAVFDDEAKQPGTTSGRLGTALFVAAATVPQFLLIFRELEGRTARGILILLFALVLGFFAFLFGSATRRQCLLAAAWTCVGLAALSKGLAVFAVVGPVAIFYVLLSGDLRMLTRSGIPWGVPLMLLVAAPWYVTLSLFQGVDDEGRTFVQRFWIHDNINRVAQGVHGDRGGIEYYVAQLAYGMFPWSALIPSATLYAGTRIEAGVRGDDRRGATLFVMLWALWTFVFFSVDQTKFHHYIFPAVPAFAVLVGVWLTWLLERPSDRLGVGAAAVILALFAVIARDLVLEPQHLVNLFTYKYDRAYPREVNPRPFILAFALGGAGASVVLYAFRQKAAAIAAFVAVGLGFGAWVSHHHFNMLAPHWSQRHLFDTYFKERKGDEPIYAYQLNWRGETLYSRNRTLQIKESGANARIRALVDLPGREFIITEQSRYHTLKNTLSPAKREKLQILDRSNNKYYLCLVED